LFIINQDKSLRKRIKPAIKYSAPFLVVSAVYFVARYYALGFALNNGGFKSYSLYKVALTIPLVIWKYIGLLVWPVDLSLFHATSLVKSPFDIRFILPLLGLIPLTYGLWRLRGSTVARFAILWFAVNLLPVLNLSAFTEDFMVQERYVYLPSIGFSLLVAMALTKIPIRRFSLKGRIGRVEYAIAFLTLTLMALVILLSGSEYRWMAIAIWVVANVIYFIQVAKRLHDLGQSGAWFLLQVVPLVGIVQTVVLMASRGNRGSNAYGADPSGTALVNRLRLLSAITGGFLLIGVVALFPVKTLAQNEMWKDDMSVWRHGVETASEQSMSHFILGHKYILHGDYVNAANELEQYMKLNPNNVIVISNLAASYVLIYQFQAAANSVTADRTSLDRALELCEKGMSITDTFPPLWDTLGTIYTFDTGLKNYDRAIACFQRGLSFNSGNAMINFHLGGTLIKKGNSDLGMRFLKTALELEPGLVDAHKFLAYAYESKGQIKDAINELSVYLQLQPNAPDASKISKDVENLRARLQTSSPQG